VRPACCKVVATSFGLLRVKKKDLATATFYGDQIAAAAQTFLRLKKIGILIVDGSLPGYRWGQVSMKERLPSYPWHFVDGTRYLAKYPPNEILPHEIGHDLVRLYFVPNTKAGRYGTDAPDWLDEAVAVSFEMPADKVQRRCQARSLLEEGRLIPLSRFLAMTHPSRMAADVDTRGSANIVYRSTAPRDTPEFYSMSLAFSEYFAAVREDPGVLVDFLKAFSEGKALDLWAVQAAAEHRRITSIENLDADFRSWIRKAESYRCGRGGSDSPTDDGGARL
jgi:hypothetical protein